MSNKNKDVIILGIESSCDDTSAAVCINGELKSNVIANQSVHEKYGGVVPELASRAHQQQIVPVVHTALEEAGVTKEQLSAVAFTVGPGLLGSLLVGSTFGKSLALGLGIPIITVNHMQAHVLAHFIDDPSPSFPFLCLTVSGGHTQLVLVHDYLKMEVIGETIDDAAGEAFDKSAKMLGLKYPGGPLVDKFARTGNPKAFEFARPKAPGLNFSFSGFKTSVLYSLRKWGKDQPTFVEDHLEDLCASIQHTIVDVLLKKLKQAAKQTGSTQLGIAGGVSANSGLRQGFESLCKNHQWEAFIPAFQYCTDNAAMIAYTGYQMYLKGDFADQSVSPKPRFPLGIV